MLTITHCRGRLIPATLSTRHANLVIRRYLYYLSFSQPLFTFSFVGGEEDGGRLGSELEDGAVGGVLGGRVGANTIGDVLDEQVLGVGGITGKEEEVIVFLQNE